MRWTKTSNDSRIKTVRRYAGAPGHVATLEHTYDYFTLKVYNGLQATEIYMYGSNYCGDWAKAMRRANAILHTEHWY